jgi:CheY-like chemotaxis protein
MLSVRLRLVPRLEQQTVRVLLVEDEPALRNLLATALQREFGCEVVEAHHGAEALKELHKGDPFDLLITDVRMPYVSGQELARAVCVAVPSLPILSISGYVSGNDMPDADAFLAKPFSRDEFVRTIRELTSRHDASR